MLWIIDDASIVGVLDNYNSIVWAVQFSGLSEFDVYAACTDENVDLLREGRILCRDEDRAGSRFTSCMIIRKVQITYDAEDGYILHASGTGLKGLLSQRVIWAQENYENTRVDLVVTGVVANNTPSGKRALPHFRIATPTGAITATGTFQVFGENLADWIVSVAQEYGFGWDVVFDSGDYVLELYASTNRTRSQSVVPPVIFSRAFDNLISCDYKVDYSTYRNAALVGGEGEGTAQRTAEVGTATGINRFEAYVDGSGVSSNGEIITLATYEKMLKQYGQTELENHAVSEEFSAEINLEIPYQLGVDYNLGDVVEVDAGFGISAASRLAEVIFSEDENGKQTSGTFEDWRTI